MTALDEFDKRYRVVAYGEVCYRDRSCVYANVYFCMPMNKFLMNYANVGKDVYSPHEIYERYRHNTIALYMMRPYEVFAVDARTMTYCIVDFKHKEVRPLDPGKDYRCDNPFTMYEDIRRVPTDIAKYVTDPEWYLALFRCIIFDRPGIFTADASHSSIRHMVYSVVQMLNLRQYDESRSCYHHIGHYGGRAYRQALPSSILRQLLHGSAYLERVFVISHPNAPRRFTNNMAITNADVYEIIAWLYANV